MTKVTAKMLGNEMGSRIGRHDYESCSLGGIFIQSNIFPAFGKAGLK